MKDVQPLTPTQRSDFNSLLDHADNIGSSIVDPGIIDSYKRVNPATTLTSDHIPQAINEINNIKSGQPIGDLSAGDAAYIHSGLSDAYKSNPYNLNYPVSPTHGTALEAHVAESGVPGTTATIPKPNYDDPASRLNYARAFAAKYGPLTQGRGDTPLHINEVPRGGSDTAKNIATAAATKQGIDPALLYSSAMEEGMSGLFKNPSGTDTKGRNPGDFGYQDNFGDKQYPINGDWSFGVNSFSDRFPELVKKGYLDKDFKSQFRGPANEGQYNKNDFKTTEAAMQAKAALVKSNYDDVDNFSAKNNIHLTPKSRDFMALVGYNAGGGTAHQMITDYNKNGLLENDKFMEKRPVSGEGLKADSYKNVYENVKKRIVMAQALKKEQLF